MELPSLNSGRLISIYEFTYTPEIFLRIVPKSKTKTYKTFPQKILYYMIAILYYLSFVPFRFQNIWNSKTGYFDVRLYSNGFQKILCAAMHIILLTLTVHLLFATFGPDEQGNIYANSILDSTLVLVGSGMIWYFIYTVWFDQTHFLFLAQMDTLDTHKFAKHKYNIKDRIQNCIATVIPVILLMSSLYQFCIANLNSKYVSYTVQFWFKMLFVFQLVLFNFPEDIFIVTALRLRDRAQLFLDNNFNSRDIENRITTSTIIREYYELDDFVNELNDKFGFWLLIHMVVGIPYLSQKSVEFFKGSTSFISVLLNIPVMFAHIFFLFVAASVTQKINNTMRRFLRENAENIELSNNQMSVILSKLSSYPIGLRGKNFFVVTYSFVGSVISVIITLAFIDQRNSSTRFGKDIMGSQTLNTSSIENF